VVIHYPNALDMDLKLFDSALGLSRQEIEHPLVLKRARNLDVDEARAEMPGDRSEVESLSSMGDDSLKYCTCGGA